MENIVGGKKMLTTEALGLLYGLVLAKNLELKVIHIEGDSTLLINSCIKRQIINWRIKYIMSKIWYLIDSFDSCLTEKEIQLLIF